MATREPSERWTLGDQDLAALLRESLAHRGESLWQDARRRLRRNRAAFTSLCFLVIFGLLSFLAPLLPIPSPKAMDLSAAQALPPRWPWATTKLAADWDPERNPADEDIAPGVLPTRAIRNLFNDGWRHRALLEFRTPGPDEARAAILERVARLTGRRPRLETRPGDEPDSWRQFVSIPLQGDDAPRVDYEPTGAVGQVTVWRSALPLAPDAPPDAKPRYRVTYRLDFDRPPEGIARWSVEQLTRRGRLFVTPRDRTPGTAGLQYTFLLDRRPEGEAAVLVIGNRRYDADGALPPEASSAREDLQTARAQELRGQIHQDLGLRVAAELERSPIEGVEFVKLSTEPGTWPLNALDRWLRRIRVSLFGSWQTGNWMGSDDNGRDVLARIVWGSRTSILVALAATACSLIIGVVYGALSGLLGGRIDNLMMRIVDVLYSVPFIFVVIFLITIVNEYRTELEDAYGIDRELIFYLVIGAIYWLTMARVVRGQVLSLKGTEFIEAARVLGASTWRILFSHLVPNVLSIVIVYLTLTIPAVMLFEAFLSFLGLGIEPPKVSWGLIAVDGTKAINPIRVTWWLVVFPALAMGTTLLSLNVLGDGLRDALDPKMRGKE